MSRAFCLGTILASGILAVSVIGSSCAQQPEAGATETNKSDAILPGGFPVPAKSSAQPEIEQLSAFASRLLQYADSVGCRKHDCQILITDFVSPEGNTSLYGKRIADELAAAFARQQNKIHVIDRSLLQPPLTKLREDRVPGSVQHSVAVTRWLGHELGATVVLIGEFEKSRADTIQVTARLQSVKDKQLASPSPEATLPLPPSTEELSPTDSPSPAPQIKDTNSGERLYQAGLKGLTPPACFYMPNPPYSDEARKFNLSGTILIQGIIEADGSLKPVQIIRGLPFGLNETSIKTMRGWKCHPSTLDGKPVRVLVPFEITFRLY